jgi:hypothetical protein
MARLLFFLFPFSTHNLLFYSGANLQFSHQRTSIPIRAGQGVAARFRSMRHVSTPLVGDSRGRPTAVLFLCAGMIPLWEGGAASLREDPGRPLWLEEDSPYADLLYREGELLNPWHLMVKVERMLRKDEGRVGAGVWEEVFTKTGNTV